MAEKVLFLEPSSALSLFIAQKIQSGPLVNMIYKLALLYDRIEATFYDSALIETVYHSVPPYAKVDSFDLLNTMNKVPEPNGEIIADLHRAYDEPEDAEGGEYAYYGIYTTLMKASETKGHFYTQPSFREGFLAFCKKHKPDYLDLMKQSFLCFDILKLIFDEQLSSFSPELTLNQIKEFTPLKIDFQNGIFNLSSELSGSYRLSEEQKNYIRKKLAHEEQELLEFLKPENLNKFDISKVEVAAEITSMAMPFPLPLGVLISFAQEIREIREFNKKGLNFILSIYVLKKLASAPAILEVPKCKICSLSRGEIEVMSDEECDKIILSHEFCERHIIAYLNIRKIYGLWGKDLLLMMKKMDQLR
jgi:hypothetical protein